ncbi:MAG: hypothetical protein H6Q49_1643, partial [Deltaproteobacteria bacterium]|nr:hypothetical protein [Deltaproteobacteria bacterium]
FYVYRVKDLDDIMPWDIIDVGMSKKKLMREYEKALAGYHEPKL